jgi:hypothetical protein
MVSGGLDLNFHQKGMSDTLPETAPWGEGDCGIFKCIPDKARRDTAAGASSQATDLGWHVQTQEVCTGSTCIHATNIEVQDPTAHANRHAFV